MAAAAKWPAPAVAAYGPHVSTSESPDQLIGRIVADRYEVVRKLNEGGVGAVYLAIQRPLDRPVALKVLLKKFADDTTAIRRFEKEAAAVARLAHANIVTLYDFGTTDDGDLYIAMELLRGQSLRELLDAAGFISWERSLHIIQGVTRALVAAHTQKIVHRDLKPENIMLVESNGDLDFAKVLDFGLARSIAGGIGPQITRHDVVAGTPAYMAPERANGIADDPRSDLYALGALWFELLVGEAPFVGETSIKVILRHVHEQPRPPSLVNTDNLIPDFIDELVLELLQKQPEQRPSSARVLLDRLDVLARPAGWHVGGPADLGRRGHHDHALRDFSDAAGDPTFDLNFSIERGAVGRKEPVALLRRKAVRVLPTLHATPPGLRSSQQLSSELSSSELSSSELSSSELSPSELSSSALSSSELSSSSGPSASASLTMPLSALPVSTPAKQIAVAEPLLLTRKKTVASMPGVGTAPVATAELPSSSSSKSSKSSKSGQTTEELLRGENVPAPPPVIESVAQVAGWLSMARSPRAVAELCSAFLASRFDRALVVDLRGPQPTVLAQHGVPTAMTTPTAIQLALGSGPVLELAGRREAYYGPAMAGADWMTWFGAVGGPVPGAMFVGGLGREGSTAFLFYADHKDRVLRPAVKDTVVLLREAAAALSTIG